MTSIIFVCYANFCRSPMAEVLCRHMLGGDERAQDPEINISSAGINASTRGCAHPNSVQVMHEGGLDLSEHVPTQLIEEMVDGAGLILTMETYQRDDILAQKPEARERVFTLLEYVNHRNGTSPDMGLDIDDPYGLEVEAYRRCADEISGALKCLPIGWYINLCE